jgi:hypothetical protein
LNNSPQYKNKENSNCNTEENKVHNNTVTSRSKFPSTN